ncbi:hypothetical protein DYB31_000872 [Aphanomyces astaci]|uniref:Tudor domain-containing protein n=1 Tax=Aphanomyces astaci TaxID=112090 RepID=A0A397FE03_APHAT|nr:hypothetical protein DYB31_000872 [Aphanomyces astaci]
MRSATVPPAVGDKDKDECETNNMENPTDYTPRPTPRGGKRDAIDLRGCFLQTQDMPFVTTPLGSNQNTALQDLVLSHNRDISDEGGVNVLRAVAAEPLSLHDQVKLDLLRKSQTHTYLPNLLDAPANATLRSLCLSEVGLSVQSALRLALVLEVNTVLTHLDVSMNGFADTSNVAVTTALGRNRSLTLLNYAANPLSDAAAAIMAASLATHPALVTVHFSGCFAGPHAGTYVATSLTANHTITSMDLTSSGLKSDAVVAVLAQALERNTSLTCLHLGYNKITLRGCKLLKDAIAANKTCQLTDETLLLEGNSGVKSKSGNVVISGGHLLGPLNSIGIVDGMTDDSSFFAIQYDDGEREEAVPRSLLRLHEPGTFSVGSRVLARYNGGDDYYGGVIADINLDGQTYAISYDDGEYQDAVPFALIVDEGAPIETEIVSSAPIEPEIAPQRQLDEQRRAPNDVQQRMDERSPTPPYVVAPYESPSTGQSEVSLPSQPNKYDASGASIVNDGIGCATIDSMKLSRNIITDEGVVDPGKPVNELPSINTVLADQIAEGCDDNASPSEPVDNVDLPVVKIVSRPSSRRAQYTDEEGAQVDFIQRAPSIGRETLQKQPSSSQTLSSEYQPLRLVSPPESQLTVADAPIAHELNKLPTPDAAPSPSIIIIAPSPRERNPSPTPQPPSNPPRVVRPVSGGADSASGMADEAFSSVLTHQQEIQTILNTIREPVVDNDSMVVVVCPLQSNGETLVLAKLCDGGDPRVLRLMTAEHPEYHSPVHLFVSLLRQGHQYEDQKVACAACTLVLCMKHGTTTKVQQTAKGILRKDDLRLRGELFDDHQRNPAKPPPKPKPRTSRKPSKATTTHHSLSTDGEDDFTPTKSRLFSRNTMAPAPQLTHNVADSLTKIQQYSIKKPSTAFEFSSLAMPTSVKKPPKTPDNSALPVTKHTFTPFEEKLERRMIQATLCKLIPAPSPTVSTKDREDILLRTYGVPKLRHIDRIKGLPSVAAATSVTARPSAYESAAAPSSRGSATGRGVSSAKSVVAVRPPTIPRKAAKQQQPQGVVPRPPSKPGSNTTKKPGPATSIKAPPPRATSTIKVVKQNLSKTSTLAIPAMQHPSNLSQLATQLFHSVDGDELLTDKPVVEARLSFSDKLHEMIKKAEVALCRPPSAQSLANGDRRNDIPLMAKADACQPPSVRPLENDDGSEEKVTKCDNDHYTPSRSQAPDTGGGSDEMIQKAPQVEADQPPTLEATDSDGILKEAEVGVYQPSSARSLESGEGSEGISKQAEDDSSQMSSGRALGIGDGSDHTITKIDGEVCCPPSVPNIGGGDDVVNDTTNKSDEELKTHLSGRSLESGDGSDGICQPLSDPDIDIGYGSDEDFESDDDSDQVIKNDDVQLPAMGDLDCDEPIIKADHALSPPPSVRDDVNCKTTAKADDLSRVPSGREVDGDNATTNADEFSRPPSSRALGSEETTTNVDEISHLPTDPDIDGGDITINADEVSRPPTERVLDSGEAIIMADELTSPPSVRGVDGDNATTKADELSRPPSSRTLDSEETMTYVDEISHLSTNLNPFDRGISTTNGGEVIRPPAVREGDSDEQITRAKELRRPSSSRFLDSVETTSKTEDELRRPSTGRGVGDDRTTTADELSRPPTPRETESDDTTTKAPAGELRIRAVQDIECDETITKADEISRLLSSRDVYCGDTTAKDEVELSRPPSRQLELIRFPSSQALDSDDTTIQPDEFSRPLSERLDGNDITTEAVDRSHPPSVQDLDSDDISTKTTNTAENELSPLAGALTHAFGSGGDESFESNGGSEEMIEKARDESCSPPSALDLDGDDTTAKAYTLSRPLSDREVDTGENIINADDFSRLPSVRQFDSVETTSKTENELSRPPSSQYLDGNDTTTQADNLSCPPIVRDVDGDDATTKATTRELISPLPVRDLGSDETNTKADEPKHLPSSRDLDGDDCTTKPDELSRPSSGRAMDSCEATAKSAGCDRDLGGDGITIETDELSRPPSVQGLDCDVMSIKVDELHPPSRVLASCEGSVGSAATTENTEDELNRPVSGRAPNSEIGRDEILKKFDEEVVQPYSARSLVSGEGSQGNFHEVESESSQRPSGHILGIGDGSDLTITKADDERNSPLSDRSLKSSDGSSDGMSRKAEVERYPPPGDIGYGSNEAFQRDDESGEVIPKDNDELPAVGDFERGEPINKSDHHFSPPFVREINRDNTTIKSTLDGDDKTTKADDLSCPLSGQEVDSDGMTTKADELSRPPSSRALNSGEITTTTDEISRPHTNPDLDSDLATINADEISRPESERALDNGETITMADEPNSPPSAGQIDGDNATTKAGEICRRPSKELHNDEANTKTDEFSRPSSSRYLASEEATTKVDEISRPLTDLDINDDNSTIKADELSHRLSEREVDGDDTTSKADETFRPATVRDVDSEATATKTDELSCPPFVQALDSCDGSVGIGEMTIMTEDELYRPHAVSTLDKTPKKPDTEHYAPPSAGSAYGSDGDFESDDGSDETTNEVEDKLYRPPSVRNLAKEDTTTEAVDASHPPTAPDLDNDDTTTKSNQLSLALTESDLDRDSSTTQADEIKRPLSVREVDGDDTSTNADEISRRPPSSRTINVHDTTTKAEQLSRPPSDRELASDDTITEASDPPSSPVLDISETTTTTADETSHRSTVRALDGDDMTTKAEQPSRPPSDRELASDDTITEASDPPSSPVLDISETTTTTADEISHRSTVRVLGSDDTTTHADELSRSLSDQDIGGDDKSGEASRPLSVRVLDDHDTTTKADELGRPPPDGGQDSDYGDYGSDGDFESDDEAAK